MAADQGDLETNDDTDPSHLRRGGCQRPEALRNEDGEDKAAATTLYEAKMKSEQPPATATNKAKCA